MLPVLSAALMVRADGIPAFSATASDQEARLQLLEALPILKDDRASDVEKVSALRSWVHQSIPAADSASDVSVVLGHSHHELTTAEMLSLAGRRDAGMMCGGHAELMRRLCRLLGYEAVAINFAVPGTTASHVLTLVRVPVREQMKWLVEDAYFNTSYTSKAGDPLSFQEIIARVTTDRTGDLCDTKPWDVRAPALMSSARRESGEFEYVQQCWSLASTLEYLPEVRARLEQLAGTAHPAALLLFPIGTSGELDAEALANLARSAAQKKTLLLTADRPDVPRAPGR